MCDVRGLGTSEKRERIYSLDSAFPIFNLLFSFCFSSAKWADVGGGVTWLLFCLVFPGLQGMVQMTMIILIIILIINILIIVTCITVYLLSASESKFLQLIIIKVPILPITSDERVYMLTFKYEFNKIKLYQ